VLRELDAFYVNLAAWLVRPTLISATDAGAIFLQSDWGNFELLVPHGNVIRQYFRDNNDPALRWRYVREFGYAVPPNSLGPTPRGLTLIQSNFKGNGGNGNFEVIVRVVPLNTSQPNYLDFWYLDSSKTQWNGPFRLSTADGQAMDGVTGERVMIQSDWGNFELLVPHGNVIKQYRRNNADPALPWIYLGEFGYTDPPPAFASAAAGVTFIQSSFKGDGSHGNFEAIVRVAPASGPQYLDFWYLDSRPGSTSNQSPLRSDWR